ncbi:MAG: hypothetical protein ACOYL7_05745 [Caldilinea sp.]|jgi:hypothetical protein
MTENFVESAKNQMGGVERLLKGLPGIRGYVDKELRRDADKRVREAIAASLDQSRAALVAVQNNLLKAGGLALMDEVNEAAVALQTLADRIKTASYGYAGLFDPVRVKEAQLDALVRFDQALAREAGALHARVEALAAAIQQRADFNAALEEFNRTVTHLNSLFGKRGQAIEVPTLLDDPAYLPSEDPGAAR